MFTRRLLPRSARLVAYSTTCYGLGIIADTLLQQLHEHGHRHLILALATLPVLVGISYVYLGSLLLRLKRNAWLLAVLLAGLTTIFNGTALVRRHIEAGDQHPAAAAIRAVLAVLLLALLALSRREFRVRSDLRGFRRAVRVSVAVLLVALVYGVAGFLLLDAPDFHQEISLPTAVHLTIDQFNLTTPDVVPYTWRARLFVDSLSVISSGAAAYVLIAFFQPLRMRLASEAKHRRLAEELLQQYPGDLDDFFKLWPHDKHYYLNQSHQAGLAYHVARGVALVVGDPFGDPKQFRPLVESFMELCYVNDWAPSFIHVTDTHAALYRQLGFRLQKIGEEAVLDLDAYQHIKVGKYFRQIRNRYNKLNYTMELLQPPHSQALLDRLHVISGEWLARPGRAERGLVMGHYANSYMQVGPVAVVRDGTQQIQGFMNMVPTYLPHAANYDLMRCADAAPGNCNDFLLMGLIDALHAQGYKTLNLGLCPLAGLDENAEDAGLIDAGLRFVYANGDRFYSFSGLRRFKAKYEPAWESRYIAYPGGIRMFTRIMAALTRAMKVK